MGQVHASGRSDDRRALSRRRRSRLFAAFAIVAGVLLPAGSVPARPGSRVAARVNGQPIGIQRLEACFGQYLLEGVVPLAVLIDPVRLDAVRRNVLELLIEHELLWQEARRQHVDATPREVDAAVASLRRAFPTRAAFVARLAAQGLTVDDCAQHLREQLAEAKLLRRAAERRVVGDDQVCAYLRRHPDTLGPTPSRRLREGVEANMRAECDGLVRAALVERLRAAARIEVLLPSAAGGEGRS